MKKLMIATGLILLALLLAGCRLSEYRVLGYCEDDGLYYFTHKKDGGVIPSPVCKGRIEGVWINRCHRFKNKSWCPVPPPEPKPLAKPVLPLQLLIKYDPPEGWLSYCMVMTEGGVAVERQQAICGWVADNHPCGAMVYDDDTWACDRYGYYRQPLPVLECLWARHLAGQRDQASFAKCHEQ